MKAFWNCINIINELTIGIFAALIIISIFIIINFYINKQYDIKRWFNLIASIRTDIGKMIVEVILILLFIFFVRWLLNINLITVLKIDAWWKIAVDVFVILHIYSIRKSYKKLAFYDFIDDVKSGKNLVSIPKHIFEYEIEKCNLNYEILKERLDVLKTLAPVSLIPLIAGYIIEHGENIKIEWNTYTIIFFVSLCLYIWSMFTCFSNMTLWKSRLLYLNKELKKIEMQDVCKDNGI